MAAKDDRGRAGEYRAAQHLIDAGYLVVDRNWRCPLGEIDIVARRGAALVIVEVKTRRTTAFGHPFEAVSEEKLARLWRLAHAWRRAHPEHSRGGTVQIDAIGITGEDVATAPLEHLVDLR